MVDETIIVDRIEGDIAICEQAGRMLEIPLTEISGLAQEGDLLYLDEGGYYHADAAATARRRAELTARFQSLIKK